MRRAQTLPLPTLPWLEADGVTHRRDCDCARCDAGFRPSERQRDQAALRWEAQEERRAAEAALARKRARERSKALRLSLELEEQEAETNRRLQEEAALRARLRADPRLTALLQSREQGRPVAEALAEAERRHPPRSASAQLPLLGGRR